MVHLDGLCRVDSIRRSVSLQSRTSSDKLEIEDGRGRRNELTSSHLSTLNFASLSSLSYGGHISVQVPLKVEEELWT
jgi:hypothetical protein